jgi:hypothetical protein
MRYFCPISLNWRQHGAQTLRFDQASRTKIIAVTGLNGGLSERPPRERQRQILAEDDYHSIILVYRIYPAIAAERN